MKIGGPKGPAPPVEPPRSTASEKPEDPGRARFNDLLGSQSAPQATAPAPSSEVIAEVSARLQAGEVTHEQAVKQLIDGVIASKAVEISPALRDKLRQVLRDLLAEDPVLSAKVRKLGGEQ